MKKTLRIIIICLVLLPPFLLVLSFFSPTPSFGLAVFLGAWVRIFNGEVFNQPVRNALYELSSFAVGLLTGIILYLWLLIRVLRHKEASAFRLLKIIIIASLFVSLAAYADGGVGSIIFGLTSLWPELILLGLLSLYLKKDPKSQIGTNVESAGDGWKNEKAAIIIGIVIVLLSTIHFVSAKRVITGGFNDLPSAVAGLSREELGLSSEGFTDLRQAYRVRQIRYILRNHFLQHHEFPASLGETDQKIEFTDDLITGKPYEYVRQTNNFELRYSMNAPEEKLNGKVFEYLKTTPEAFYKQYPYFALNKEVTSWTSQEWHAGINIADRFSPVADTVKQSNAFIGLPNKHDYDLEVAMAQLNVLYYTIEGIQKFNSGQGGYPPQLDKSLIPDYGVILGQYGYTCEDVLNASPCEYRVNETADLSIDTPYSVQMSFPVGSDVIPKDWMSQVQTSAHLSFLKTADLATLFSEGINTFPPKPAPPDPDIDHDGLTNVLESQLGTDPRKTDTDGDSFDDKTEYESGNNPLVHADSTRGTWSACISLNELKTCDAYCQSIEKTCSNKGISSKGDKNTIGGEQWISPAFCLDQTTKGNGSFNCGTAVAPQGQEYKCYCL